MWAAKNKHPFVPTTTVMAPISDPVGSLPTSNSPFHTINFQHSIPNPPILLSSLPPPKDHVFPPINQIVWPPTQDLRRVYTCTICNKGFPSHQSLAGHRSSHSKLTSVDLNMALTTVGNHKLPKPTPANMKIGSNVALANGAASASVADAPGIGDCPDYLVGVQNEKIMEAGVGSNGMNLIKTENDANNSGIENEHQQNIQTREKRHREIHESGESASRKRRVVMTTEAYDNLDLSLRL